MHFIRVFRIGLLCLLSTCGLHLGEEVWKYKTAKKETDAVDNAEKEKVATFEGDAEETITEIAA